MEMHTYCELEAVEVKSQETETIQIITPEASRIMPPECVSGMLKLRGSERFMNLFEERKIRKQSLWAHIASELEVMGYFFSAAQYAQKFINLRKHCAHYRNNLRKPGEKIVPKPRYYGEMHRILKGKFKVSPKKVNNEEYVKIVRESIQSEGEETVFTSAIEAGPEDGSGPLLVEEETDVTKLLHELIRQQKESNAIMMLDLQHRKETDARMLEILERLTSNLNSP